MNRDQTLDGRYFDWLGEKVHLGNRKNPARSYLNLAKQLYQVSFHWYVPNDDNRAMDGLDLRYEFLEELGEEGDQMWLELDCSIFEMLIALARRITFQAEDDLAKWFWTLVGNLGLRGCSDLHYDSDHATTVDLAIERLLNRTYSRDGSGGLFPLKSPPTDQRVTEIWYQMSAYLIEETAT